MKVVRGAAATHGSVRRESDGESESESERDGEGERSNTSASRIRLEALIDQDERATRFVADSSRSDPSNPSS